MSTSGQSWSFPEAPSFLAVGVGTDAEKWFALQTHARHEKVVAQRLSDKGVTTFLPLVRQDTSLERPAENRRGALIQLLSVRKTGTVQQRTS